MIVIFVVHMGLCVLVMREDSMCGMAPLFLIFRALESIIHSLKNNQNVSFVHVVLNPTFKPSRSKSSFIYIEHI
jgi:hypothetical protein